MGSQFSLIRPGKIRYIAGTEAKLFANAPHLFEGKIVTVAFTAQAVAESPPGEYKHTNHNITFLSKQRHPAGASRRITGLVSVEGTQIKISEIQ